MKTGTRPLVVLPFVDINGWGLAVLAIILLPFTIIYFLIKGAVVGTKKLIRFASHSTGKATGTVYAPSDAGLKTALVLIADALFFPVGAVLLGVWYKELPQKTRSALIIATVFISICAIVGYLFVGRIALDVYRESFMRA